MTTTTQGTPEEAIRNTQGTPATITDEDKIVANIEYRNKVECYKLELEDLITSGMFYSARTLLNKCIKEISDYRSELCKQEILIGDTL